MIICRHNVIAAVIRVGDGKDLEKLNHMYINVVSVRLTSVILEILFPSM